MSAAASPAIAEQEAEILAQEAHPGEQFVLRLHAPRAAAAARPGQFVHLRCGPCLPLRRPLSIQRTDPDAGWIELLYKRVGAGTSALAEQPAGTRLPMLGPIGVPFRPDPRRPYVLLLGGGVGIPPMIFAAQWMRGRQSWKPLAFLGSEVPFPFAPRTSRLPVAGLDGPRAAMPLLEEWGVPSRLASGSGLPGCHPGHVTELAEGWLAARGRSDDAQILACGPHAMLKAVAALARRHRLPCQVSLEEYMACAVGGCAGCVVRVSTPGGPAMRRVCVDGPVFDAEAVFDAGT
jgi:dihydroorotate dehydrogenase electron transfer subunit